MASSRVYFAAKLLAVCMVVFAMSWAWALPPNGTKQPIQCESAEYKAYLAAFQQTGDAKRFEKGLASVLEADPDNVFALAIAADIGRHGLDGTKWEEQARRGVEALESWSKPECMTTQQFEKLHHDLAEKLYGAMGFAALLSKEYSQARGYYRKAVEADPSSLEDLFPLAIAELEMDPLDTSGFVHVARAIYLAEHQGSRLGADSIAAYGKKKYRAYYGTESGWDELVRNEAAAGAEEKGSVGPKE